TAGTLLGKGSTEAKSLGLEAAIASPALADDIVSRADAQMRALAANIDDEEALPEELRGVTAPAETGDDESSDDQSADTESEPDADADDDDDDDDGGDAGEGLGEMFG